MTSLGFWALVSATMILMLPSLVLTVQVVMACLPQAARASSATGTFGRVTVLVPAHNEAAGIARTVECLREGVPAGVRILVVADNCSDLTATVAREAGAEVIERCDTTQRGKGFALDFGMRWLASDPPDVLVVVDADCEVHGDGIERLAQRCNSSGRPVQALYLMRAPAPASLRMRISEFAWVVKNQVRPQGSARLGAPCQLMGTGMAFPWSLVASVSLANGHLVEDMKLGVDMAQLGAPPVLAADVLVTSTFPMTAEAIASQRQRWEHGHLAMLGRAFPRLVFSALARRDVASLALAADLLVPPLALLVMLQSGVFVLCVAAWWVAGWIAPLVVGGVGLFAVMFAVLLAWLRYGRSILSGSDLLRVPTYVLWKIPLYLRFLFDRQVEWVRTKRDGE